MVHDTRKSCFATRSWHNDKDIIYSGTVCFSEKEFQVFSLLAVLDLSVCGINKLKPTTSCSPYCKTFLPRLSEQKCEVNSIRRILAIGYRITTSSVLLNFIDPSLHVFLRSDQSNLQYRDDLKPDK